MKILTASCFEAKQIVQLMSYHHQEAENLHALTFDYDTSMDSVLHAIGEESSEIILVAKIGPEVIGYLWFAILCPHYSTKHFASEQYLYVRPDYRNGVALFKLLKEAEHISANLGCTHLQVGVTSKQESLIRAYEKRYESVGGVYIIQLGE